MSLIPNNTIIEKNQLTDIFDIIRKDIDASSSKNFDSFVSFLYITLYNLETESEEYGYWQAMAQQLFIMLHGIKKGSIAVSELVDAFYRNLEFGTGGMRGILGPGSNRINLMTIGKAAQGFAFWLKDQNRLGQSSVVIAHDSRKLSAQLSDKCALIMAASGIKAYVFQHVAPTPLLSYAVRHLGATGGVVITASHNPAQYNGFKVYRADGCQVTAPQDREIVNLVNKQQDYRFISKQEALAQGLYWVLGKEIDDSYVSELAKIKNTQSHEGIKIGFSALHGTGDRLVPRVIREFGLGPVHVVSEQAAPNGDFPTVLSPNPEDPQALAMAIEQGKRNDLDIVMATDPDADRVGIAVLADSGYVLLNGNQTGAILAYYILERLQQKSSLPQDGVLIKTIVTSQMQKKIADSFGLVTIETLTGFKYIGDIMSKLEKEKSGTFLFGSEESYGYLVENFVRDKDGISACYFIVEAANYYAAHGKRLLEQLEFLYEKFGYYHEQLLTENFSGKSGMEAMEAIMDYARRLMPTRVGNYIVSSIYDLLQGKKIDPKIKSSKIDASLPPSNVIQFDFVGGHKMTLRPSGTEPKIKFYFSITQKMVSGQKSQDLAGPASQEVDLMMRDFRRQVMEPALLSLA